MKIGIRTPSPTKSVKARTTGRVKRTVKRSYNPFYGIKGIGYLKDPERAVKNKIYHKVTVDPLKPIKKNTRELKGLIIPIVLFYLLGIVFFATAEFIFLYNHTFNVFCIVAAIICFVLYVLLYKRKYG